MDDERKRRGTILIVEDDADIGSLLLHILTEETMYDAVLVTNPLEALEIVENMSPTLFLLNYQLPHMNGIQLYDRLHEMPALARVQAIMVSANLPVHELEKRGIIGLHKPIDIDNFIECVERLAVLE